MRTLIQTMLAGILLAASLQVSANLVIMDSIVAVVDEDVILQSEMQERIDTLKAQITDASQLPPDDVLRQQIVERLIVESLQLQMADRAGVRISDEEINEALQGVAEQNKMSVAQFRAAIEKDGISYASMRRQIEREMMIARVQQGMMRNRIEISEQEIKNFLASELGAVMTADEYRIAHILIPLPEDASATQIAEIQTDAEDLLKQLAEGADFSALAVGHSAGQNALSGGDLGWRKIAQLPSMFADTAKTMVAGDVRGPIQSGSGFHLIKLLETRGAQAEGQIAQSQVRHVLIQPSEIRTDEEALEMAESLREEVANGRAFDEIAKLYSDDPGSALSGGDLGWARAGTYVPAFEALLQSSELDALSPVFKSQHGYHFLEVTGRRIEDFSDRFRMGQAENYLRNQRFDEELQNWIREIRDDAFVEIRI
ncbi:peptidylprolyl isomerase [Pseudomonadales bacterium]|nr:peptidylprolyl isomerase [Pseudomonadales bacterium]MDB9880039.1 peptidylprolyl isomerase [Pseudomonadales bacterium]